MLDAFKDIFRRRYLRKYSSTVPTGIIPVSQVRTAVAFIDVEDTSFDKCKIDIQAFYRENHIKGEIFFFDFRKIDSQERLITSITNTILKKDLDIFGKPSKEKVDLMLGSNPDMFISLVRSTDFPIEFMAKCSTARFKVGRIQLPGDPFDLVISEPEGRILSEAEIFSEVKIYLAKIG